MATFTWTPDFSASKNTRPNAGVVQFGDGYMQRVSKGINPHAEVWTLTFNNRTTSEIDAIIAFLEALNGTDSFQWTAPRESTAKMFVCLQQDGGWSRTIGTASYDSLSVVIRRVYEP